MEGVHIFLWVMIGIIILMAGYLAFIYIMIKRSFHKMNDNEIINYRSYPCYLNIILSSAIAINNISRLVSKNSGFLCGLQAFILAVFDKLIFSSIIVNAYLTYRGLLDNEYYMKNIKPIFIIANSISLGISVILGIIFVINGITDEYNVCYVIGGTFKENIDSVVTLLLYLIFLYSSIKSLLFLLKNIKELSLNKNSTFAHLLHFYRILFSLFLCSLAFLVTLLIINDSLFINDDFIDLCFIILCLAIDLFYTMNSTVLKQTLIIFGCKEEERGTYFENEEERTKSEMSLDSMNEN